MSSNARAARRRAERKYGGPPPSWRDYQLLIGIVLVVVIGVVSYVGITKYLQNKDEQTAAEKYCAVYDATHEDATAKPPATTASSIVVPPTTAATVVDPNAPTTTAAPGATPTTPASSTPAVSTTSTPAAQPGPTPDGGVRAQTPTTAVGDSTPPGSVAETPGSAPPGSTPGTTPGTTPVDNSTQRVQDAFQKRRDAAPDSLRSAWDTILLAVKTPSSAQSQQTAIQAAVTQINDYAKNSCGKSEGDLG